MYSRTAAASDGASPQISAQTAATSASSSMAPANASGSTAAADAAKPSGAPRCSSRSSTPAASRAPASLGESLYSATCSSTSFSTRLGAAWRATAERRGADANEAEKHYQHALEGLAELFVANFNTYLHDAEAHVGEALAERILSGGPERAWATAHGGHGLHDD